MAERVLTARDLNRALLARQLLLVRSKLPLTKAVERVGGIQAQYAPSSYIGLWSRIDGFALDDLTRALERRRVVQGTLLRSTIHLVPARDYWAFALGSRAARQEAWLRFDKKRLSKADMTAAAKEARKALAGRVEHRDELLALARKRDPERPTHLWNGLSAWLELVRAPPSGTWKRRRADLYALADEWLGPPTVTPEEGVRAPPPPLPRCVRPCQARRCGELGRARSRRARAGGRAPEATPLPGRGGPILLDLPRAPLPGGSATAPVRFLPPGTRRCSCTLGAPRSCPRTTARSCSTRRRPTRRRPFW